VARGPDALASPIFVTGAGRSGKTLLRWLLSSHSRIALARRTDLWARFDGRFGDLGRRRGLQRCLRALAARKQVAALGVDLDRVRAEFGCGEATYGRLFALVLAEHARAAGKVRWGEQSEDAERCAEAILAAFPGARLLHVVRDPRDRYAATVERDGRRPGGVLRSAGTWRASVAIARRNLRCHPGACLVVRYEDLVARPAPTLAEVCAFVGEEFEPVMLRAGGVRRYDRECARSGAGGVVSGAYVGAYRAALPRREVALLHALVGREMRALGYLP
jgi:hypothetical protein